MLCEIAIDNLHLLDHSFRCTLFVPNRNLLKLQEGKMVLEPITASNDFFGLCSNGTNINPQAAWSHLFSWRSGPSVSHASKVKTSCPSVNQIGFARFVSSTARRKKPSDLDSIGSLKVVIIKHLAIHLLAVALEMLSKIVSLAPAAEC